MQDVLLLDKPITDIAPAPPARVTGAEILAVIPALNEARHIETCVRSLMTGEPRLALIDLVVADGGSTDETRQIVQRLTTEFPNLRLLANPKKLQSAAVNLAATQAGVGRRILIRCDAHAIYPANFIMRVADALAKKGSASLVVPMDTVGKTCFQKAVAWVSNTPLGTGGSAHRSGVTSMYVDHGHHAGFDLKTFLHVGGYDETFSHNEDAEFDTRLRQAGGRIFLDATIRLIYLPRATPGALAKQYFNYGKGRARTLMKHGERPRLRQLIPPAALIACLTAIALAPLNPWSLLIPGAYVSALILASLAMAVKHKSPCGLFAGLASAIIHMTWSAGLFRQFAKGQRL